MFIKVLSTFLVLQLFSFAAWQGVRAMGHKSVPNAKPQTTTEQVRKASSYKATNVRFAAKAVNNQYVRLSDDRKHEITQVLAQLPERHYETLETIVLDYNPKAHRGLGGKRTIILRAVDMSLREFTGVLVHELGHTVDLGHLNHRTDNTPSEFMDGSKPVYEGDPSLDFYRISWENDLNRKKTASNLDFVSGYAMTDPFEDFAESYVYYILHNKEFKQLTAVNETLLKKYNFIKNVVFNGKEFDTGEVNNDNLWFRPWDITVLPYEMERFIKA